MSIKNLSEDSLKEMLEGVIKLKKSHPVAINPTYADINHIKGFAIDPRLICVQSFQDGNK